MRKVWAVTSRDLEGEEVSQLYLWGRSAVATAAPPPALTVKIKQIIFLRYNIFLVVGYYERCAHERPQMVPK